MAAATIIVDSKHSNNVKADPGKNVLGPLIGNSIGNN